MERQDVHGWSREARPTGGYFLIRPLLQGLTATLLGQNSSPSRIPIWSRTSLNDPVILAPLPLGIFHTCQDIMKIGIH